MPVTKEQLLDFQQFADEKLNNGGADSLGELVLLWEAARSRGEVNEAIRRGIADVNAGRHRPADEFFDEVQATSDIRFDA